MTKMLVFIFLMAVSCKNNQDVSKPAFRDTSLKILTYGLRDMEGDRTLNAVAKKYGFSYLQVAGCVITQKLQDSVCQENRRVHEILTKRLGNDWDKRFQSDLDTFRVSHDRITELVKEEACVIVKMKELEQTNNHLHFEIDYTERPKVFYVNCYSCSADVETVSYFKFQVDLNIGSVVRIS